MVQSGLDLLTHDLPWVRRGSGKIGDNLVLLFSFET